MTALGVRCSSGQTIFQSRYRNSSPRSNCQDCGWLASSVGNAGIFLHTVALLRAQVVENLSRNDYEGYGRSMFCCSCVLLSS